MPHLARIGGHSGSATVFGHGALRVRWRLDDGVRLGLVANLDKKPVSHGVPALPGDLLFETAPREADRLPPWYVGVAIEERPGA